MIDIFCDFALTTNHRSNQQFQMILSEALQWTENYYHKYRHLIEQLLVELYNNILEQLTEEIDSIAKRAAKFESNIQIENCIKTVIQQEIIKVEIEKMKNKYTDISFLDQLTDPYLLNIAQKSEFLIAAQRNANWLFEPHKKFRRGEVFAKETILTQILLITDILIESDENNKRTTSLSNYKQLFTRKTSFGKDIRSLDLAKERLSEISSWLVKEKTYINEIIDISYDIEK